jgi:hypothetical protein
MSYLLQDSLLSFLSYESLKSRKRRIFLPTSYIQGQKKYGKPRKPLSPPGLVCRHKKGDVRKKKKEKDQGRGSVATRRGCEKKKKRKEKDQGRQEGGSCEGKVLFALNQEFLFLVHEYLGLEAARLG